MLAAVGVGMALRPAEAIAQATSTPQLRIIDTHHHIYPPQFLAQNLTRIVADAAPIPASLYLNWSPKVSLDQMDRIGVAAAVTSITSPGVWFGETNEGRRWARACNEYGARMVQDFPTRFGMFAAVPLPDQEGSLREIEYALDVLKLDGIGLLSSYVGKHLGDPAFAPVFNELNRRKVTVFVHPTMSACCVSTVPYMWTPTIEFPADTARTVSSLLFSGTFARCPNIRFIFPHGGGALPMLMGRIAAVAKTIQPERRAALFPQGIENEVQKLFYDIATITNAPAIAALQKLIPMTQILFGADTPFGSLEGTVQQLNALGLSADDVRAIERDNALRLFPRFKT